MQCIYIYACVHIHKEKGSVVYGIYNTVNLEYYYVLVYIRVCYIARIVIKDFSRTFRHRPLCIIVRCVTCRAVSVT